MALKPKAHPAAPQLWPQDRRAALRKAEPKQHRQWVGVGESRPAPPRELRPYPASSVYRSSDTFLPTPHVPPLEGSPRPFSWPQNSPLWLLPRSYHLLPLTHLGISGSFHQLHCQSLWFHIATKTLMTEAGHKKSHAVVTCNDAQTRDRYKIHTTWMHFKNILLRERRKTQKCPRGGTEQKEAVKLGIGMFHVLIRMVVAWMYKSKDTEL